MLLCLKPLYRLAALCCTQIFSPQDPRLWPALDLRSITAGRNKRLPVRQHLVPALHLLSPFRDQLPLSTVARTGCCFCQEEGRCMKIASLQPRLSPHHRLKQPQLLPGGRGGERTARRSQAPSLPGSCISRMWGSDVFLFVLKPTESISAPALPRCWGVTRSSSQGTPGTPALHVPSPSLGTPPWGASPFPTKDQVGWHQRWRAVASPGCAWPASHLRLQQMFLLFRAKGSFIRSFLPFGEECQTS